MAADDMPEAEESVTLPGTTAHGDMPIETRMLARQVARAKRLHTEAMDRVAELTDALERERKGNVETLARIAKDEALGATHIRGISCACRAVPGRDAVRMSIEVEGTIIAGIKSEKDRLSLYHAIGEVVKSFMSAPPFRPSATGSTAMPHSGGIAGITAPASAFRSGLASLEEKEMRRATTAAVLRAMRGFADKGVPLPPPEDEGLYETIEVVTRLEDEQDEGRST